MHCERCYLIYLYKKILAKLCFVSGGLKNKFCKIVLKFETKIANSVKILILNCKIFAKLHFLIF